MHAAVDDHSRRAAEILADEKGTTRTAFLTRAAAFFTRIERVMADNARNYRASAPSCAAAGVVLGRPASGASNPANRAFADPPQLMSDVRPRPRANSMGLRDRVLDPRCEAGESWPVAMVGSAFFRVLLPEEVGTR